MSRFKQRAAPRLRPGQAFSVQSGFVNDEAEAGEQGGFARLNSALPTSIDKSACPA